MWQRSCTDQANALDAAHLVGPARALELLAGGAMLTAIAAAEIGLVNAVAPADQSFAAFVRDYAARFAAREASVLRAFKAMTAAQRAGASRAELLALEAERFAELWTTDAHWAAVAASDGRAGRM